MLLAAGSAFAGPNCKKSCPKDGSSDEGVFEVAEREGDGEAREGKRGERGERGERGDRERRSPLKALDLTEDQQEAVQTIMDAAREESKELMASIKAKKEAGEEVDRESVREQMMAIRKGAMDNVYENVLTEEQQAKMDELRAKMEERRAQREAEGGERPERKGKGERKERGGEDLDL
eukprot:g14365.t1